MKPKFRNLIYVFFIAIAILFTGLGLLSCKPEPEAEHEQTDVSEEWLNTVNDGFLTNLSGNVNNPKVTVEVVTDGMTNAERAAFLVDIQERFLALSLARITDIDNNKIVQFFITSNIVQAMLDAQFVDHIDRNNPVAGHIVYIPFENDPLSLATRITRTRNAIQDETVPSPQIIDNTWKKLGLAQLAT